MDARFGFTEEKTADDNVANKAELLKQFEKVKKSYDSKLYSAVIHAVEKIKYTPELLQTDEEIFFHAVLRYYVGSAYYQVAMSADDASKAKLFDNAVTVLSEATILFDRLQNKKILDNKYNLSYHAASLSTLGECQKHLGHWSKAIVELEKALKNFLIIQPAMKKSLDELEQYKATPKEKKQLDALIKTTAAALQNTVTAIAKANLSLGQLHTWFKTSDNEHTAENYLLTALKHLPSEYDQMICLHFLGMCYLQDNNVDNAIKYLTELLEMAEDKNTALHKDATLGLGLCEGVKSQFTDKESLQKLATAYTFYQWNTTENRRDLPTCRGVVKQWLNCITLPADDKQPNELKLLSQMISVAVVTDDPVQQQTHHRQHTFV